MISRIVVLSMIFIIGVKAQENAGSSVAKSLLECYNKTENLDRELRPPSSITVLIDLIRKIESGPSIQNDREISKELIHRFKQDGIIKLPTSTITPYSVPYSPRGMQADKHKILLQQLIPGSAINFPEETLNEIEKCSLHFMLSDSIDIRERGDESYVCNKLGRFQRRFRRRTGPKDNIEILDLSHSLRPRGNLQNEEHTNHEGLNPDDNHGEADVFHAPSSRQTVTVTLSECPVENGAVYTKWGTIQAGNVISGIAAGREPQTIHVEQNYIVNSIYAATLVGDLSEVALHQGAGGKDKFEVGAKGGWNNTQTPRWYFINKILNNEMTDAEIRGDLDGLIIAKNINDWRAKSSTLKISQILDMYYSPRGVFSNKKFRACNRNFVFMEVAPEKELTEQTIANSFLLNQEAKLPGSVTPEGIKAYSEEAVTALINYIAELHNLPCDNDPIERISTDILLVLDFQWDFNIINRALGYLFDNLDINKYASNFTIINGKEGEYVINSTYSIINFYETLNRTVYFETSSGFDITNVFNSVEKITMLKMDEPELGKKSNGKSSIVLFVPYNALNQNEKTIANDRRQSLKNKFPDLKLLVLGRNAKDGYSELVADTNSDAFSLSDSSRDGSAIVDSINSVVARIKQIQRRIINYNCGSSWSGSASSDSFEQYVEPGTTNYYRIIPNYFYGEGNRNIKVRGYGYGNIVVCMSRQKERPQKNSTDGSDKCETISSNEVIFQITDMCKSYDNVQSCPPIYLSVEATNIGESRNVKCHDKGCRFPDNIKYTIQPENLGCKESGSYQIAGNAFILVTTYIFVKIMSN